MSDRVLLIDIDSKIPNLALMKISGYYKARGAVVGFDIDDPTHVYISCIFAKNRARAKTAAYMARLQYPRAVIDVGGPGYDLVKCLPDSIERAAPDYDLYPDMGYSMGFTTRGCIRKCPFCIVPKKEGRYKRVATIEEIYNPRFRAIKLLDNNILADPANFIHICEFAEAHKLKIDFSQGLDARLLTPELADALARVRPMSTYTFAFDSLAYRPEVERAIKILKGAGINVRGRVQFYVYCDNSITGEYGIKSAIARCNLLKEWGTNAYVMLNIDAPPSDDMRHLKRWANRKAIFWTSEFKDYKTGAL